MEEKFLRMECNTKKSISLYNKHLYFDYIQDQYHDYYISYDFVKHFRRNLTNR